MASSLVCGAAQKEPTPERGRTAERESLLVPPEASVWIEPIAGRPGATSVMVGGDSTKVGEIIGTTYEWFPERYADWK